MKSPRQFTIRHLLALLLVVSLCLGAYRHARRRAELDMRRAIEASTTRSREEKSLLLALSGQPAARHDGLIERLGLDDLPERGLRWRGGEPARLAWSAELDEGARAHVFVGEPDLRRHQQPQTLVLTDDRWRLLYWLPLDDDAYFDGASVERSTDAPGSLVIRLLVWPREGGGRRAARRFAVGRQAARRLEGDQWHDQAFHRPAWERWIARQRAPLAAEFTAVENEADPLSPDESLTGESAESPLPRVRDWSDAVPDATRPSPPDR